MIFLRFAYLGVLRLVQASAGWFFAVLSAGLLVFDLYRLLADEEARRFLMIADAWKFLHRASLRGLENFVDDYLWTPLWDSGLSPLLSLPLWIAAGLVAPILIALARRANPYAVNGNAL